MAFNSRRYLDSLAGTATAEPKKIDPVASMEARLAELTANKIQPKVGPTGALVTAAPGGAVPSPAPPSQPPQLEPPDPLPAGTIEHDDGSAEFAPEMAEDSGWQLEEEENPIPLILDEENPTVDMERFRGREAVSEDPPLSLESRFNTGPALERMASAKLMPGGNFIQRFANRLRHKYEKEGRPPAGEIAGIPNPFALESRTDFYTGLGDAIGDTPSDLFPFSPNKAVESVFVYKAAKRLEAEFLGNSPYNEAGLTPYGASRGEDANLIDALIEQMAEDAESDPGFYGKIGSGSAEMPVFILEFVMTGGASGLLRASTKALAEMIAAKAVAKGVMRRVSGRALRTGVVLVKRAGVRTPLMGHRITTSVFERMTPAEMRLTEKGLEVIQAGDPPAIALARGAGEIFIEMLSEEFGGLVLRPVASALLRRIPGLGAISKEFMDGLRKEYAKLPGKAGRDFVSRILEKGEFGGYGLLREALPGSLPRMGADCPGTGPIHPPRGNQGCC